MKRPLLIISLCAALSATVQADSYALERLRKAHENKIAEVNQIYVKELVKLKDKAFERRDLAEVTTIVEEIKKFDPKNSAVVQLEDKNSDQKDSEQFKTTWDWGGQGWIWFHPNGTARFQTWSGEGTWVEDEKNKSIIHLKYLSKSWTIRIRREDQMEAKNDQNGVEIKLKLLNKEKIE